MKGALRNYTKKCISNGKGPQRSGPYEKIKMCAVDDIQTGKCLVGTNSIVRVQLRDAAEVISIPHDCT